MTQPKTPANETNEQICCQCFVAFAAIDSEDIYATDNWGNVYICKSCIGPLAKYQLGDQANV